MRSAVYRIRRIVLLVLSVALLCACRQGSANGKLNGSGGQGAQLLAAGNYQEAIDAFTAAIEADPTRAQGYLDRAQAYLLWADRTGRQSETGRQCCASAAEDYRAAMACADFDQETKQATYRRLIEMQRSTGSVEQRAKALDDVGSLNTVIAQDKNAKDALLVPANRVPLDYGQMLPLTGSGVWDCDRIRHGYFIVFKDSQWGLAASDGSEILPCLCNTPGFLWDNTEFFWSDSLDTDFDFGGGHGQYDRILRSQSDMTLILPHGGYSYYIYTNESGTDMPAVYMGGTGYGEQQPLSTVAEFNRSRWLPCGYRASRADAEFGLVVEDALGYNYVNQDGSFLLWDRTYSAVGWFSDGFAAVCQDGKWGYIDEDGNRITNYDYEAICFGSEHHDDAPMTVRTIPDEFCCGYAVVRRNGQYGLIDSMGVEVLPCRYDGAVQCNRTLWLKEDGSWHLYRINESPYYTQPARTATPAPVVPFATAASGSPEASETPEASESPAPTEKPDFDTVIANGTITKPDYILQATYNVTVTADGGLRLRRGPTTDSEKIAVIDQGAKLTVMGTNIDATWLCVDAGRDGYGWVSAEFTKLA